MDYRGSALVALVVCSPIIESATHEPPKPIPGVTIIADFTQLHPNVTAWESTDHGPDSRPWGVYIEPGVPIRYFLT